MLIQLKPQLSRHERAQLARTLTPRSGSGRLLVAPSRLRSSRRSESSRRLGGRARRPSRPARSPARRCVQPRGHPAAPSARSGKARTTRSGEMWPSPKLRTPGVSITQPPPGRSSGSATADEEVCRPRPVTGLTVAHRPVRSGTSAFTSVDLPTPRVADEHADSRPASRAAQRRPARHRAVAGRSPRSGRPSGA